MTREGEHCRRLLQSHSKFRLLMYACIINNITHFILMTKQMTNERWCKLYYLYQVFTGVFQNIHSCHIHPKLLAGKGRTVKQLWMIKTEEREKKNNNPNLWLLWPTEKWYRWMAVNVVKQTKCARKFVCSAWLPIKGRLLTSWNLGWGPFL